MLTFQDCDMLTFQDCDMLIIFLGTNGGVSVAGTFASGLGGLVVGVAFYLSVVLSLGSAYLSAYAPQWPIMIVCTLAGLLGSLIDSLLGATLQYSGMFTTTYLHYYYILAPVNRTGVIGLFSFV